MEALPLPDEAIEKAAAARDLLLQVSTHFDRIQLGVQAALQFQESLAGELRNQKGAIGQLFTLFGDVRDAVDQKVLLVQGQLQQLREKQDTLAEEITHAESFSRLREDLAQLRQHLDEFGLHQKELYTQMDLQRRLEGLEALQAEVRAVLSGASAADTGAWAHQETLLVKTELQALRAEVRALLDQSPPAPGHRPAVLETGDERVQQLQDRLNQLQRELDERTARIRQELEPLDLRLRQLDEASTAVSGQLAELPALRNLGSQLEQAYQTLGDCWRSETDAQAEQLAACARRLEQQQQILTEQGEFIRRLKGALG